MSEDKTYTLLKHFKRFYIRAKQDLNNLKEGDNVKCIGAKYGYKHETIHLYFRWKDCKDVECQDFVTVPNFRYIEDYVYFNRGNDLIEIWTFCQKWGKVAING